jgi:hypothetical protein
VTDASQGNEDVSDQVECLRPAHLRTESKQEQLRNQEKSSDSGDEESVEEMCVYQINDSRFWKCPYVNLKFGPKTFNALVDTGSQISLISEEVYNQLTNMKYPLLELPVQSTVVVTAFGNRSMRLKKQTLLEFEIVEDKYEHVFFCIVTVDDPYFIRNRLVMRKRDGN